jgi:hypothetical protein
MAYESPTPPRRDAASETLRNAVDTWVAEASVVRRPQTWPPKRRLALAAVTLGALGALASAPADALTSAPVTPPAGSVKILKKRAVTPPRGDVKTVMVVKGTAALFCPQPCTTSDPYMDVEVGSGELATTSMRRDGGLVGSKTRPTGVRAESWRRRVCAELAATRKHHTLAREGKWLDEQDDGEGNDSAQVQQQLPVDDVVDLVVDDGEQQLPVEGTDVEGTDTQDVVEQSAEDAAAQLRRDEKMADMDFPTPWQDRGDGMHAITFSRGAEKRKWSDTADVPPATKPKWTHAQWMNWRTSDDDWRAEHIDAACAPSSSSGGSWEDTKKHAMARWIEDGQRQGRQEGAERRSKRRGGVKVQERRRLAAAAPETMQALKRATEQIATGADLDLLFQTYGPQALSELLDDF